MVRLAQVYHVLEWLTSIANWSSLEFSMNLKKISFHNGTTRFVIAIPCAGIALKIAQINPLQALRSIVRSAELAVENNNSKIFIKDLKMSDEVGWSFRGQFRGIYANLREYRFYKKTRNQFLWPTFFSLFGLINIQPLAPRQPEEKLNNGVWMFVLNVVGKDAYKDGHTLSEEANFAVDNNGHLRILDYGGARGQKIITEHGAKLYTQSRFLF